MTLFLECIKKKDKSMYEYFGFKTYGTYKIGQSEVDSNGEVNHRGKGFTIYFMIYYKGAIHNIDLACSPCIKIKNKTIICCTCHY